MRPLGVLKKPPFVGTALDIDTTVFPFVDKTGRHLIANSGVTLLSGAAHFPNNTQSSTNYLRITDNPLDFNGQYNIGRGFKITMVFKLDGFPSSDNTLFRLKNVGGSTVSDFYVKSSGAFVYYNESSSYISATGLIQVGIEYTLEVISIVSSVRIYLNSILLTTNILGASPTGREINIGALTSGFGGYPSLNGYGFQGSLSQFKYDVTY